MSDETLDLRELLGKSLADFPTLPDLPEKKTFYGRITGISAGNSTKKGTPYFDIGVRLTDPGKDVTEKDMADIKAKGFSLTDYDTYARFYLTQGGISHPMYGLRPFMESLGFASNVRLDELLRLDPENFNPTEETQELLRGREVICRTDAANEDGKVFRQLNLVAGIKRD